MTNDYFVVSETIIASLTAKDNFGVRTDSILCKTDCSIIFLDLVTYEMESKKAGKASFAYAWVLDETGEERER